MRRHPARLWGNSDFAKLWIGRTVSNLGSGISGIALPLVAVITLSATPLQMGILSALGGAAALFVSLLAGAWADRVRRRPLLIVADLGRALLLGSVPLAALAGVLHIEQLYAVAALTGILSVFFNVADQSYLPSLVQESELMEANSKLGVSDSLAEIGGPALAGPLVQLLSAPIAVFFDALSFLVSALCLGLIRKAEQAPAPVEEQQSMWRDITDGLRFVVRHPLLRALAASAGIFNFFGNFIGALYSLYVIRTLGAPPIILGLIVAAGGISALIGALLAERVVQRFGPGRTIGGALLLYGIVNLLIPLARGPLVFAVALLFIAQLIGDVTVSIHLIAEVSLRQSIVPTHLLGRANASMQFLTQGVAPLGALLAGGLGAIIGLRPTIFIGVMGVILASCWLLLSPVRKVRTLVSESVPEAVKR
jgi:MFS family permease